MKNILFILFLAISSFLYSQNNSLKFPQDFVGVYTGELVISAQKKSQKIPMEFHLLKTDSIHKYEYKLVYNKVPRNYTLVVKDQEQGLYEIDENNGIVLPASEKDNILYSFFEVQGSFLSTRLNFNKPNTLEFEILFSNLEKKVKTGGVSEKIPTVYGYPISVFQKAILTKKN